MSFGLGEAGPRHTWKGGRALAPSTVGRVASTPCSSVELAPEGVRVFPPRSRTRRLLGPGSRAAGQPPWNAAGVSPAFLGRRFRIRVVDPRDHAEPAGRAEGSNLCPGQGPSSNGYPVGVSHPVGSFRRRLLVRLAERRRADCSGVQASCRPVGTHQSSVDRRRWQALAGAWPSGAVGGPSSMHV